MAQGTGSTFGQFKISIGDGADPEVFAFLCGVTSKGITYSSETVETEMPDCTDEDKPSFKNVDVKSVGIQMQCSGLWTSESHETVLEWWKSAAKKNVKVEYSKAETGDTKTLTGPAVLGNLANTVDKGQYMSASFDLMFSEMPVFADAA